jgi:hypothetical protein
MKRPISPYDMCAGFPKREDDMKETRERMIALMMVHGGED